MHKNYYIANICKIYIDIKLHANKPANSKKKTKIYYFLKVVVTILLLLIAVKYFITNINLFLFRKITDLSALLETNYTFSFFSYI